MSIPLGSRIFLGVLTAAALAAFAASSAAQGSYAFGPLGAFPAGNPAATLRGFESRVPGEEVASLGDITGDGVTDFVTGDRSYASSQGAPVTGRVLIVSGRPTWSWVPNAYPSYQGTHAILHSIVPAVGSGQIGLFGFDVADAGNFDADTHHDVIVGAPSAQGTGRAYLYSSTTGTLLAEFRLGSQPGSGFGWDVKGVGDLDGGGRPELAIGAVIGWNDGEVDHGGRVYVFRGEDVVAAIPNNGHAILDATSALAILSADAAHESLADAFGANIAALGDSDGSGGPDSLLVGAPSAPKPAGGGTPVPFAGAAFVFKYDPTASPGAGSNPWHPFVLRTSTLPSGASVPVAATAVFEGAAECSQLGFDNSCAGDFDQDGIFEFVIGVMGRHPGEDGTNNLCPPSHGQNGYAWTVDGASGTVLAMTTGVFQPGDKERYGAYVAGDADLDLDASDCDFDGDLQPDVVVTSYRKKFDGNPADVNRGSLRLYDGAGLVAASWQPLLYGDPFSGALLLPDTMYGFASGSVFGEAVALLPRSGGADWPRIAASEIGPQGLVIDVLSPFGAVSVPTPPSGGPAPASPTLDWNPAAGSSGQRWTNGALSIRLSATAATANFIWVIPSLTLSNVLDPGAAFGVAPFAGAGADPLYTYLDPAGLFLDLSAFGLGAAEPLDFAFGDWIDVLAQAGPVSAGQTVTIPFDLSSAGLTGRWPNHALVGRPGTPINLQVVEVTISGGTPTTRASNLTIVRGAPDA